VSKLKKNSKVEFSFNDQLTRIHTLFVRYAIACKHQRQAIYN